MFVYRRTCVVSRDRVYLLPGDIFSMSSKVGNTSNIAKDLISLTLFFKVVGQWLSGFRVSVGVCYL